MAKPNIKVQGDKQLIAKLKALGDEKLAKRILRKAVNAAGQQVVKAARANVQSDTGALKKAITKKVVGKNFNYSAIIGADVAARGPEVDGTVRMPANYDHLVEFGYQHASGKTVPGHSFLRKGFDQSVKAAQDMLDDKLAKGIEAAAKKGG